MQPMYYIGLDVHKRKISYCVKDSSGKIHTEGSISATSWTGPSSWQPACLRPRPSKNSYPADMHPGVLIQVGPRARITCRTSKSAKVSAACSVPLHH